MDYKKMSRGIRLVFAVMILAVLAIVMAAEFNLAPIEGMLVEAFDAKAVYGVEVGMLFLTGICILLALKAFDRVLKHRMSVTEEKRRGKVYVGVYCVRLALLALPMLFGAFFYYALLENWGMYYALACFVAMLFCLPSAEGVEVEMNIEN